MTKSTDSSRLSGLDSESLADTLLTYQRPILIGAIVVAAGVLGGWLWMRSAQIREERASEAYQSAEAAFTSGNRPLAQSELERLVTRFSGTASGSQSAMLLAQLLYEQSKFAEGIAQLETALRGAPKAMRPGIHALIAGGQEGAGKPLDAAAAYGRASAATPFEVEKDQYRMEQARTLANGGDRAGAEAIYRSISGREDSSYGAEARLRLGELTSRQ